MSHIFVPRDKKIVGIIFSLHDERYIHIILRDKLKNYFNLRWDIFLEFLLGYLLLILPLSLWGFLLEIILILLDFVLLIFTIIPLVFLLVH